MYGLFGCMFVSFFNDRPQKANGFRMRCSGVPTALARPCTLRLSSVPAFALNADFGLLEESITLERHVEIILIYLMIQVREVANIYHNLK